MSCRLARPGPTHFTVTGALRDTPRLKVISFGSTCATWPPELGSEMEDNLTVTDAEGGMSKLLNSQFPARLYVSL